MSRSSGNSSVPPRCTEAVPGPPPAATHAAVTGGRLLVRPTSAGTIAIVLVLAAGVVAVNSGNNLLYFIVASLLSVFALSGLVGNLNLRGVDVRLAPPDEVWAGRPVAVNAEIVNRRRRMPAFLLGLGGGKGPPEITVLEVQPGSRQQFSLTLTFPARGVRPWPSCTVTSEFPFGLIRRGGVVQPPGACLVYPAPLPVAREYVAGAEREGERLAGRLPGRSGDHRGLRDYAPGDSISRVRWKSWLRLRKLLTKEFDSESGPQILLRFDAMPGPGTEERLGQLAWLVRTGIRQGTCVGLVLPGLVIPPGGGTAHRRRLLTALARFGEPA